MGRRFAAVSALAALLPGCTPGGGAYTTSGPVLSVFTADIQAGIERHVEEQVLAGNGHFRLPFQNHELRLKLVRVHTEYLSHLGPRRYFACVDLADVGGDVYDVDFFLAGDPHAMTVTETTVHKINGQPYYVWNRRNDGTWHRIPVDQASQANLGVIQGKDEFEFRYRATLPALTAPARMWLPLPRTDRFQTVELESLDVPGTQRVLEEREHGNRILLLEFGPQDGGRTAELRFKVQRHEKSAYEEAARIAESMRATPKAIAIAQRGTKMQKNSIMSRLPSSGSGQNAPVAVIPHTVAILSSPATAINIPLGA